MLVASSGTPLRGALYVSDTWEFPGLKSLQSEKIQTKLVRLIILFRELKRQELATLRYDRGSGTDLRGCFLRRAAWQVTAADGEQCQGAASCAEQEKTEHSSLLPA